MKDSELNVSPADQGGEAKGKRLRQFAWFTAGLCLVFILPLIGWIRLAVNSELNSHVVLIPFVSVYLVWMQRRELVHTYSSSPAMAVIPIALGVILLTSAPLSSARGWNLTPVDILAFRIAALWLCLLGGALFLLGTGLLRQIAFPVAFLGFMVPMPDFAVNGVEIFLQRASAEASELLFWATATTYFRDGQTFRLPGVVIRVAQECSGVRSSYALFMTSLVAGHLFLRSPWRRGVLAFCVIPLGIIRNGFRIWTLATLAWRWDPKVLDSPLHHRGGPIFFALSLIPFFLLLWWLRKGERKQPGKGAEGQSGRGTGEQGGDTRDG